MYVDSLYFAMCIMSGMGSDKLASESNVNYWIVDAYTIVSIPLFAIFIRLPSIHTCIHTYIHTNKHTYVHTNIHTHMHTDSYIRKYISTCIYLYIHTFIYTYIHISYKFLTQSPGIGD